MDDADLKIDKTASSTGPLPQADGDLAYWLTKTPEERLNAVELKRQAAYGYDAAVARLERVFTVIQRDGDGYVIFGPHPAEGGEGVRA